MSVSNRVSKFKIAPTKFDYEPASSINKIHHAYKEFDVCDIDLKQKSIYCLGEF